MSDLTINLPNGYRAEVTCEHDDCRGAPWEEEDGHGPISDWENRDAKDGERILCSDRGFKRFYDFAEAVKIAKRDKWDAPPYGQGTKVARATRAVEADFKRMRAWCNDEWSYIGVCVEVFGRDGSPTGFRDSLWGVESDGDYWREVAKEMCDTFVCERAAAWRRHLAAARIERRKLLDTICYG